jgi:hypothetical protein
MVRPRAAWLRVSSHLKFVTLCATASIAQLLGYFVVNWLHVSCHEQCVWPSSHFTV